MQSTREIFAQLETQLADQSSRWREARAALESLDPRALLPVDLGALEDFAAACSAAARAPRSAAPVRGIRV